MKTLSLAVLAILNTQAVNLSKGIHNSQKLMIEAEGMHACDYVDDNGEEIDTSLALQLTSDIRMRDDDDAPTVEDTQIKMAEINAQMEANVKKAEANKKKEEAAYKKRQNQPDSEAKSLLGLMDTTASLHRIGLAFHGKSKDQKMKETAEKLGIEMTPDIMALGTDEAISGKLVELAVASGKSEDEIAQALEWTLNVHQEHFLSQIFKQYF